MKEETLDENSKLIQKGNSGEAYYGKDPINTDRSGILGAMVCKGCERQKPFEKVRWNDKAKAYICLDCLRKSE